MSTNKIPQMILRKKRDLGETINAVFEFVDLNKKNLYRVIILVALPFGLLGGVLGTIFTNKMLTYFQNPEDPTELMLQMFGSLYYWGMILMSVIGYIVMISVTYVYIKMYMAKEKDLSVNAVWGKSKEYLLPIFLTQLAATGFIGIPIFTLGVIVNMLAKISGVFLFIGFLAIIAVLVYLCTALFLVFPVLVLEDTGVLRSFGRAMELMKGHFWRTFGVLFVLGLIGTVLSFVVSVPAFVLQQMITLNSIDTSDFTFQILNVMSHLLSNIGNYLVMPFMILGPVFHLFSLIEIKEQTGLLERIEAFGKREKQQDEEIY